VSDEQVDPETLAAFLDGTLAPGDRAKVMRVLAESPEAYADFVDASAVHRELQPAKPIRHRGVWYFAPLLLAAGVVGLLVVRRGHDAAVPGMIALAQTTRVVAPGAGGVAASLGDAWDQPGWSVVRGESMGLGERARAFRAGARYAELEVAAQAVDSAAARRLATILAETAGGVDAGTPLAAQFRVLADAPSLGGSGARERLAEQLRTLLRMHAWFDIGAWTETARLAVAANDLAFFSPSAPAIPELRRIIGTLESSPEQRAAASGVVDALRPLLSGRSWSVNDKSTLSGVIAAATAAGAR
jgi:hypothetical protein